MYIYIRYIMIHSDRYVLTVYLCPVYIYIFPHFKGVCTRVSEVWHNRYCHAQNILCCGGLSYMLLDTNSSFLSAHHGKEKCCHILPGVSWQATLPHFKISDLCITVATIALGYRLSTASALCLPMREGSWRCMCGLLSGTKICQGHGEMVVWGKNYVCL